MLGRLLLTFSRWPNPSWRFGSPNIVKSALWLPHGLISSTKQKRAATPNNCRPIFKDLIERSKACVAYTGAGISTASGISDYASKAHDSIATNGITERLGGMWQKNGHKIRGGLNKLFFPICFGTFGMRIRVHEQTNKHDLEVVSVISDMCSDPTARQKAHARQWQANHGRIDNTKRSLIGLQNKGTAQIRCFFWIRVEVFHSECESWFQSEENFALACQAHLSSSHPGTATKWEGHMALVLHLSWVLFLDFFGW